MTSVGGLRKERKAAVLQQDPRAAARERDLGLRKIGRLTWRAGLAGAACSVLIALTLGHHPAAASTAGGTGGTGSSSSATNDQHGRGSIVIPAQPPRPAAGSGQVTSGGS